MPADHGRGKKVDWRKQGGRHGTSHKYRNGEMGNKGGQKLRKTRRKEEKKIEEKKRKREEKT